MKKIIFTFLVVLLFCQCASNPGEREIIVTQDSWGNKYNCVPQGEIDSRNQFFYCKIEKEGLDYLCLVNQLTPDKIDMERDCRIEIHK